MGRLSEHPVDQPDQAPTGLLAPEYRATTVGFVLIVSLIAFETLAVGTAMPTIVRALDGLALYGWAFTSLLLANVIGVVLGGELCDRVGARASLTLGLAALFVGLVLSGLAPTMLSFLLGRSAQGFGGGMVIVSLYVLAARVYPEALRPKLFAVEAAAWVAPAMIGPFVAGVVVDHIGWRVLFLCIAPFVALSFILIWSAIREASHLLITIASLRTLRRWLLALPAAGGLAAIQWAGQNLNWTGGILGILGLVTLTLTLPRLLPAGIFSLRAGIPVIALCRGVANGAYNGIIAYVPLMLVTTHGFSATAAGVPLTIGTLGWAAASWAQSRLHAISRTTLLRIAFCMLGVAAVLLAFVSLNVLSGFWTYPIWVLGGAGVGTVFPILSVLLLEYSPASSRGADSSGFSIAETMAAALTVGIGGGLVAAAQRDLLPFGSALAVIVVSMGLLAFLGAAVAGRAELS